MAKKNARVLGPYKDREKWKVIRIDARGKRTSKIVEDRRAALRLAERWRTEARYEVPLSGLINEYLETSSMLPLTQKDIGRTLHRMLDSYTVASLTTRRATALIESQEGAVATLRHRLKIAKCFYRWLIKGGFAVDDPFAGLSIPGRAKAGKFQLRTSEGERLIDAALGQFELGDAFALAPVLALCMGLRASEACNLTCRDVDAQGSVLWVAAQGGKTVNAARRLKVPVKLRPLLVRLASGRDSGELLFRGKNRQALHNKVRQLCCLARVPVVCPHSLRGLWASLSVEAGVASEAVAAALGHGSFAVTARHYATASAVHAAGTARATSELMPDHSAEPN